LDFFWKLVTFARYHKKQPVNTNTSFSYARENISIEQITMGYRQDYNPEGLPEEGKKDRSDPLAVPTDDLEGSTHILQDRLRRSLSARQVQMIAIGGTIGTGLFLGTGKSLATGGPASILICYAIVGFIVFVTMLSLGEMAAFLPVAGSFCTYAG
jgi:AAT family amino acid transporter